MADVIRLTCLEQGIAVVEEGNVPHIRMEGLKLFADYPKQAQK